MDLDVRSEVLRDAPAFSRYWSAINELRFAMGFASDVLLNPIHFLASTDDQRRSCSVAVWRGEELIAILYATQHYARGIATGYAIGGDFSGRGLLICSPANERLVLREAMRRMSDEGVHSMHLRLLPREETFQGFFTPVLAPVRGLKMKILDAVIPGDLLHLGEDFEEFLGGLGKHTRRNIRAYIRKTEQAGIVFAETITKDEYGRAVKRLNSEADFPADPLRLERDERLLGLHHGERIGLRSADGTIIALLCGFRKDGRFHLMTQLNDAKYERFSLSLVLRAYTSRYLIEGGVTSLHFLGGSSLSFGRYCEPETYRSIFVDRRTGVAAIFKTLVSSCVHLMRRMERPVPERMAMLCGGNLDDQLLAERTVLRPAAMLMRQRSESQRQAKPTVKGEAESGEARRPLLRVSA